MIGRFPLQVSEKIVNLDAHIKNIVFIAAISIEPKAESVEPNGSEGRVWRIPMHEIPNVSAMKVIQTESEQ